MDYHVKSSGKVLVHCHAGLGRTGLMVACYLVFSQRLRANAAVELVRRSRVGSIQTTSQVQFVNDFEQHLVKLFQTFRVEISDEPLTLETFMKRQGAVQHVDTWTHHRYLPRHLHLLLCRALALVKSNTNLARNVLEALSPTTSTQQRSLLAALRLDANDGRLNYSVMDVDTAVRLAMDWLRNLSEPVLLLHDADSWVSYIRCLKPQSLKDFLDASLSKFKRHLIGMMFSFLHVVAVSAGVTIISRPHLMQALQMVVDTLMHTHEQGKVLQSPVERSHVFCFAERWLEEVQATYFSVSGSGTKSSSLRIISAIGEASAKLIQPDVRDVIDM